MKKELISICARNYLQTIALRDRYDVGGETWSSLNEIAKTLIPNLESQEDRDYWEGAIAVLEPD